MFGSSCRSLIRAVSAIVIVASLGAFPAQAANFDRKEDVVYGRKYGTALTLDVFQPKSGKNGLGVIFCVSGGWFSAHEMIPVALIEPLLNRGYTVFAVVHGSQPKFQIPEVLSDMHRAVRFIRFHARDYQIDPERLGIYGASAGGHLSLMQGTAGQPGNPDAKDPIDRESSRVRAVACFFPPTDFLNYGKTGQNAVGRGILNGFQAPFEFQEMNPTSKKLVVITDEARRNEIARTISPVYQISADDAPTLIAHGDADALVPIQQAELFLEKLKAAGVATKLVVKPGAQHGWPNIQKDIETFGDWFDTHLKSPASTK